MLVLLMLVPKIMFVPLIYVSPTDFMLVVSTTVFMLVPLIQVGLTNSGKFHSFKLVPQISSQFQSFKFVNQFQVSPVVFMLVSTRVFMLFPQFQFQFSCQSDSFHVSPKVFMLVPKFSCQSRSFHVCLKVPQFSLVTKFDVTPNVSS